MIFLGVDGGGSKTAAMICDEKGNVLGEGFGGPSNYQMVGMEFALGEISRAVDEALQKGGVSLGEIQRAVFGLSGADLPENFRKLEEGLKNTFPGLSFLLVNDTWIALRAGAKKGWGVCIVCGSGANACARSPSGEWFTLAGLGYESGLGGGGLDMVRDVLHFSYRAVQGTGPQTTLVPAVLEEMGVESFEELSGLLLKVMTSPASALFEMERALGMIPRVFQLASEGDWASQEILMKHGSHLGEVAGYLAKKLKEEEVDVVLQGGVFKGECPIFLDAFNLSLHRIAPHARTFFPEHPPVYGAILLAMEEG